MSDRKAMFFALLGLCGLAIASFFGSAVGNVVSHVLVPPTVYVLPMQEIEVPVIDHDLCVEVLAAEVSQPSTDCYSCHTGSPSAAFNEFTIEIAPDNGADTDTGGIRRDRWIEGEATGL